MLFRSLVQYDKAGKPFTVRYHLLTPMLLNELQKAHKRADAQAKEVAKLKTQVAEVSALKAELAQLKRVQAQQIAQLAKQLVELKANKQESKPALTRLH